MKAASIKKSYLSICPPGTSSTTDAKNSVELSVALTRRVNDYGSQLKRQYPSSFGYFACLPQSDISESLKEIERCNKELGNVDGYIVFANATHGDSMTRGLGRVHSLLNTIDAVAFMHPVQDCTVVQNFGHGMTNSFSQGFLETAVHICCRHLLLDFTRRFKRIKCILPHAEDVLPQVLTNVLAPNNHSQPFRILRGPEISLHDADNDDDTWREESAGSQLLSPERLREIFATSVWLDLAGNPSSEAIKYLLQWTDHTRLLYGTNVPFMPFAWATKLEASLSDIITSIFGAETGANEALKICYGNAEDLLGP